MQEQENLSPQSPSPSNSSLASDDEDNEDNNNNNHLTNNNLVLNNHQLNGSNGGGSVGGGVSGIVGVGPAIESNKEHDFMEDMHQQLEKQIQRMRIAPPLPPSRKPAPNVPSPSRPVWYDPRCTVVESFFGKINHIFCVNMKN